MVYKPYVKCEIKMRKFCYLYRGRGLWTNIEDEANGVVSEVKNFYGGRKISEIMNHIFYSTKCNDKV